MGEPNEDRLSFASPTSLKILNINGRRKHSASYVDLMKCEKRDDGGGAASISVSKIEEVDEPSFQSRPDYTMEENKIQSCRGYRGEEDEYLVDSKKEDFSFSMEKEGRYFSN